MVLRIVGKVALLMIAVVAAAGAVAVRALGSRAASLVTAARARDQCPPVRSSSVVGKPNRKRRSKPASS